jgi:hypothetical protein
VHPNRLGRGLPLQRPAEASSAGPRRERRRDQSHWAREFNHAQRLRPAMKPTARAQPWPAHCSEQRKGAGALRSQSRVAPQGSQRAARRRRGSAPSPSRLRGPAQEQQGNRQTKQGRRSNRMTRAGENSAGGARRPEVREAPQPPPPNLSSKPPTCEPAPGPAQPGPGPKLQAIMDRQKPGTSPNRTGPGSGPGWVPGRPAGRPGKPRVGSGVPRQRVAAEGLKKRRPRTACDPTEYISGMVEKI